MSTAAVGSGKQTSARAPLSPAEKNTAYVRSKVKDFISAYYDLSVADTDIFFITEDSPFEIWSANPSRKEGGAEAEEGARHPSTIYCLWDGGEIWSFTDLEEAVCKYVELASKRRGEHRWNFFTSPLIISGIIGILLVVTTSALLLLGKQAPSQLWSILTAVVAFYFGREGSTRRSGE